MQLRATSPTISTSSKIKLQLLHIKTWLCRNPLPTLCFTRKLLPSGSQHKPKGNTCNPSRHQMPYLCGACVAVPWNRSFCSTSDVASMLTEMKAEVVGAALWVFPIYRLGQVFAPLLACFVLTEVVIPEEPWPQPTTQYNPDHCEICQKNPRVRNSGAGNSCANFMGA